MFTSNRWQDITEFVFIIAVIIGSIAVLNNQPLAYVLVPLCFALGFNWFNRKQLEQQTRNTKTNTKQLIEQHQNDVNQLMEQLQQTLNTLSLSQSLNGFNPQFNDNFQSMMVAIHNILERQSLLEQTINLMQSELEVVVQTFQKRPELQQVESLTHVIVDLQQFINQLPQWGNLQQQQLNELRQKVEQSLQQLSTQIDNLPSQIEQEVKRQARE